MPASMGSELENILTSRQRGMGEIFRGGPRYWRFLSNGCSQENPAGIAEEPGFVKRFVAEAQ